VHAFFDLCPRLGIHRFAIVVVLGGNIFFCRFLRKAERCWVGSEEAFFCSIDGAVDEFVDGVDDVVEKGLWRSIEGSRRTGLGA